VSCERRLTGRRTSDGGISTQFRSFGVADFCICRLAGLKVILLETTKKHLPGRGSELLSAGVSASGREMPFDGVDSGVCDGSGVACSWS
jgi:hypothetical protein